MTVREFDKEKVVRRVQRAVDGDGAHPRCRRTKEGNMYRVGPGLQFVKVSLGKTWATITGGEKVQRVKL